MIAIDSLFSPVTRVRYSVENARVGQRTDYDRLVLEIWTDGRISPDDALTQASAILQHHLDVFVGYDKNAVEFEEAELKQDDDKSKLKKLLNMSVNEIELSVRAANCSRRRRKKKRWRHNCMRHLKRTAKLGRTGTHRNAMLANLVCSLIKHKRVRTTLAKAKAARSVAEKMVTLGKSGTIHDRRLAAARLHQEEDAVKILFNEIAPSQKTRNGGYTRIIKLHKRQGDAAEEAILEWTDLSGVA